MARPVGMPVGDCLTRLAELEDLPTVGGPNPLAGILDFIKRRE